MADGRPLIAKIQVEHSGAGSKSSGNRTASTGTTSQKERVAAEENKNQTKSLRSLVKQGRFSLLSILGISFTISSMLKQSQIWTGTIGAVFQMIGALFDMILAPLIPMLNPLLQKFAQKIPDIAEAVANLVKWIVGIWRWIKGLYDKLPNWLKNALNVMVWGPLKIMLGTYLVARMIFGAKMVHGALLVGFTKLFGKFLPRGGKSIIGTVAGGNASEILGKQFLGLPITDPPKASFISSILTPKNIAIIVALVSAAGIAAQLRTAQRHQNWRDDARRDIEITINNRVDENGNILGPIERNELRRTKTRNLLGVSAWIEAQGIDY